jgi:type 1 glutamine amidotransferase
VASAGIASAGAFKVLVFSKTAGYRHESITNGLSAILQMGTNNNFDVVATENAADFTATNLARFRAVIFLSTSGEVLDDAQQNAFQGYIHGGGGVVGIHAASDTEYSWR